MGTILDNFLIAIIPTLPNLVLAPNPVPQMDGNLIFDPLHKKCV